ncbi:acetylcholinesterase-like [Haemaphysalis longicornis]
MTVAGRILEEASAGRRLSVFFTILVTLAAIFCRSACSRNTDPVIASDSGVIEGKRINVGNKEVDAFLGIPYAAPPIGDLRFERPRPVTPWNGTYNAKEIRAPCWQTTARFIAGLPLNYSTVASEDCLYLNVWRRPPNCAAGCNDQKRRPVIVFIHGGAFIWGDSSVFFYDPANFVALHDVVYVTFNYRVSLLGFMSLERPELPGNMGLWDQNLALKWVRANVARFGGDSSEVTLIGQSAGAISACLHMASPQSRGLFQRVVLMSGSPLSLIMGTSHRSQGTFVASSLGCYDAKRNLDDQIGDVLSCLKNLEASFIYKTIESQSPAQQAFPPVWGDEFSPKNHFSEDALKSLDVKEIVLGNVLNEGTLLLDYIKYMTPVLKQMLGGDYRLAITTVMQPMFGMGISPARRIVEAYLGSYDVEHTPEQVTQLISQLIGDAVFDCPVHLMSQVTSAQSIPTYRYVFVHRPSHTYWKERVGVAHGDDIMYVLGSLRFLNDSSRYTGVLKGQLPNILKNNYTAEEEGFMKEIMGAFYLFATNG